MTTTTDTQTMVLALASATKRCPCLVAGEPVCFACAPTPDAHTVIHGPLCQCKGEDEVFVLGPEVRVECGECKLQPGIYYTGSSYVNCLYCGGDSLHRKIDWGNAAQSFTSLNESGTGRGWNPLDPRYLGDWMIALATVGFKVRSWCVGTEKQWEFGMRTINKEQWFWESATMPGPALFQVAMKALNLPTETETE